MGQFGFIFECGFVFYLIEIELVMGWVFNQDYLCFVVGQYNFFGDIDNIFLVGFFQVEFDFGDCWVVMFGVCYDCFEWQMCFVIGLFFVEQLEVDVDEENIVFKVLIFYVFGNNQLFYFVFGEGFNLNFGLIWQWDLSCYICDM